MHHLKKEWPGYYQNCIDKDIFNMSAVYKAQCKTSLIAQQLAGQFNNVSSINSSLKPPFCLRVVKKYRTIEMQQFRDSVAKIARYKNSLN
jgi:hypothetical protein